MSQNKKIEEGLLYIQQAEKSLKTNLFKWKPDYDVAADEYIKAGTIFRTIKDYDQGKECFLKACECYKNNKSWFHAAKCYEQIILILKEKPCLTDIEEYANRASHLYQQHGSSDAAATALDKSAKILEQKHPEIALRLYQHALDIAMTDDSSQRAVEYASKISRLLVKLQMYDHAADALRREIGLNQQIESYGHIGRLAVALVLVQLGRGDFVAAEKAFKEWGNCCDSQEVQTLELLLQSFDEENAEGAAQALSSPFIKHMDVEYAILARNIALPGNKNALDTDNTNLPSVSQNENDDYNGLC